MAADACSGKGHEALDTIGPNGPGGSLLLAPRGAARARRRHRSPDNGCSGLRIPCHLGAGDDIRQDQLRPFRDRLGGVTCLASDRFESESMVDALVGLHTTSGGTIAFLPRIDVGDVPMGLRRDESRPFVVGDSSAVHGHSPSSPSPNCQIEALAALLSPVLGSRAKPQATALLRAFGSIGGVSAASPETLQHVLGMDGHLAMPFFVSRRILETGMRERIKRSPVVSDDEALLRWLVARFAGMADECLIAIYLDRAGSFLCEDTFRSGAADCVTVHPRALFRQAMRLDCGGLLLAHNHPSGDATPSALDIDATHRIAMHGALLEVDLVDHLVVAGNSVTSMRRAGLL